MPPNHGDREDDGSGHFAVEATLCERRIYYPRLYAFTLRFRERGGTERVIHLAEPDREQARPGFEVVDGDGEDASGVLRVALPFHFGDLRLLASRHCFVDSKCFEGLVKI